MLWALTAALLAATTAAAQGISDAPDSGPEKDWSVSLKQKNLWGNQGNWNADTYVDATLPRGFDLNAEFNDYKNDASSQPTPTTTFGGGWTHGQASLFGTYGVSALANNSEANAADVGLTIKTDDKEFRTTLTADVNVTHDKLFFFFPKSQSEFGLTERTPTIALTQRLFGVLDANATFSQSHYNTDILILTTLLNRPRFQKLLGSGDSSLSGLVDGFPDWTAKYQLKYSPEAVPLTLKAYYETIHLVDTASGTGQTADTEDYTAEYDVRKWLTLGVEYEHYRQTSQTTVDEYGGSVTLRY
jgi:hypothetical protein